MMGNRRDIDSSTLAYLGVDFEYKLVKCFMEDSKFFKELYPIINQNVFKEAPLKMFVGSLKDYVKEWDTVPSYETMSIILNAKAKTQIDIDQTKSLIERFKRTSSEGNEIVKENAMKFFKQQNLIRISKQILEIAGSGNIDRYNDCQKLIEEATLIGNEDEYGYSPFDLEDEALSPTFKCPIPTGISKLDDALNGGLEKGKMGLLIGSAGFGKSTFSTAIASYASTYKCELNNYEGFKVLQIYFEDDNIDIVRKHFSRITQEEARNLTKDETTTSRIKNILMRYGDKETMNKNLRLKRFNTGSKTASDIKLFIKRLTNSGFKPDMVIIDYFECLLPEKTGFNSDSEWSREAITMRKLENMAKDLDIAIWIPTQGNKGSITSPDVVTMDQAGGSIRKVQIAQVVISIARSLDDIDKNRATLAILKNRSGKSGEIFQGIKFDNGTSTISCDEVETFESATSYLDEAEAKSSEYQHQLAKQVRQKVYEDKKITNEFSNSDF